jgi:hypothetical protein
MLELALKLFDYAIKFLENRGATIDEYFNLYIQPTYEIAEKVFSDYWELLHVTKKIIKNENDLNKLIDFLEQGRIKYQPLRIRLRAEIKERYQYGELADLPPFEKGVLGILMGSVAPFNDETRNYTVYLTGEHTLLDLCRTFNSYYGEGKGKESYLQTIDKQIIALETAWHDVTTGYAQYKAVVSPTPAKLKEKR